MKHLKKAGLVLVIFLSSSVFAQEPQDESKVNKPVFTEELPINLPPEVSGNKAYPLSRWNVTAMLEMALKKLPNFTKDIPGRVKRIALIRVNSDDRFYVNTRSIQHRMVSALTEGKQFDLVECRECQNVKLFVEDDAVIVSRNIETTEELKALGKKLNIHAFLFTDVQLDVQAGEISLGLKMVNSSNGNILKVGSLTGSHSGERIHWTIEGDKEGGLVVSGPVKEDILGKEMLKSSVARGSVLLPEVYMNPLEEKDKKNLTRLVDFALLRFPEFAARIPKKLHKIAIGTFEGSQNYYLSTGLLRQKVAQAIIDNKSLDLIACDLCEKKEALSRNGKIIFKNAIESKRDLKQLKKDIGAQVFITGRIQYHPQESALDLSLKAVNTGNGKILYAQTYRGKEQKGLHDWKMTLIPNSGFYVEGPVTDTETGISHEDDILTPAIVSREFYIPGTENDIDLDGTSLDIDYLTIKALEQSAVIMKDLPKGMDKLAIGWLEGDDELYVNTRLIRYRLIQALLKNGSKQIIDCFECQKWGYLATDQGLIPQRQVEDFDAIKELAKEQGFQGFITGFVEASEETNELKLFFQVIDAENGQIIKTEQFKASQFAGKSRFAFVLSPVISGFNYKNYRRGETGLYEEVETTSFMSLGIRYLKGTPIEGLMIGADIDMIQNNPEFSTDQFNINFFSAVLSYSFPFTIGEYQPLSIYGGAGFGMVTADGYNGTNITGMKMGLEFLVTPSFSLGLDAYQLSDVEVKDKTTLSQATFKGSGTAFTLRIYF